MTWRLPAVYLLVSVALAWCAVALVERKRPPGLGAERVPRADAASTKRVEWWQLAAVVAALAGVVVYLRLLPRYGSSLSWIGTVLMSCWYGVTVATRLKDSGLAALRHKDKAIPILLWVLGTAVIVLFAIQIQDVIIARA
jgi:hypothetical protein